MTPSALLDVAREALRNDVGPELVGDYLDAVADDEVATTVSFAAVERGYAGWRWSVTVAVVGDDRPTISEVVLLPGPDALLAPPWVPWQERVRAGDLGPGDLLPPEADDPRLVPAYLLSDDPAVEAVAHELGLGRVRVLSREGREDAAERWHLGPFGPADDMARAAPAHCGTCAFYLPLAGSLSGGFGACGNEFAPADGRVVDVEFGCGAHSEVMVEAPPGPTSIVIDELEMDVHERPSADVADPAGHDQFATVNEVTVDEVAVDAVAVDEVPAGEVAVDEVPAGEVAVDAVAVDEVAVDEVPAGEVAVDESVLVDESVTASTIEAEDTSVSVPGVEPALPDAGAAEPVPESAD